MTPLQSEPRTSGTLNARHFACLRAILEGVEPVEAMHRYLNIVDARHCRAEYRHLVDRVQALAKRKGDPRWRLLGLELQDPIRSESTASQTLDEWAAERGLDGWSQAELQAMYVEQFALSESNWQRRKTRAARLRERRQALLRELESFACHAASTDDHLIGWFPERTAKHLTALGVSTIGQLNALILQGGRWWGRAKGFGPKKAARVAVLLGSILPGAGTNQWSTERAAEALAAHPGTAGGNRHPLTKFRDDSDAISAWLATAARTGPTNAQYSREVGRFRIWCTQTRGRSLVDVTRDDCTAYVEFLGAIPDPWISRRRAAPMSPGWAPFRGQLTATSQDLAIAIIRSLFGWLVEAGHIYADPWADTDTGARRQQAARRPAHSRPEQLFGRTDAAGPEAFPLRSQWLHEFSSQTGLSLAKLANARRGDLRHSDAGWLLSVGGRGRRLVSTPVPHALVELTRRYFSSRGLDFETAAADMPLLASVSSPTEPIGYRAALGALKRVIVRAQTRGHPKTSAP